MTYTYSNTDLSTDLAKVRLALGDIVEHADYSVSDEEIQRHLDDTASITIAAVRCQEDRIARALIKTTRNAAGVNADRASIVRSMQEHLALLKKRASMGRVNVYTGMIDQDRIDDAAEDTDYPDPPFKIGMDDYTGAYPVKDNDYS